MHVRTTLSIDDSLVERARELTGIHEKTALVRAGLEALIAREAGKRLGTLGGLSPNYRAFRDGEARDSTRTPQCGFKHSHEASQIYLSVASELACGNLTDRAAILFDLQALPAAKAATNGEVPV